MTAPVAIVIPSAGRAGAVLTRIAGAILYVPQSQAAAYRAAHPDMPVETHADDAYPNLPAKRQGIYERWRHVFMADDDIAFVSRLHLPGNNRQQHLTPQQVHDLIQVTGAAARRAGCYLWGFNSSPNAKHYYPHRPIDLGAYINACAIGLHPSPSLYFTPRVTAAESHWINLLNAHAHRKSWSDMRFCFVQAPGSTFRRPGGQTAHRTLESERADTLFLRRMFGDRVRLRRQRADSGLAHAYQRTIDKRI